MGVERSELEQARAAYAPRGPRELHDGLTGADPVEGGPASSAPAELREAFPRTHDLAPLTIGSDGDRPPIDSLRIGVVLSGGQAPGGHNVIAGIYDAACALHPDAAVLGFTGGPRGVMDGDARELTATELDRYRNTGGFDLIGSGRDKIDSVEQRDRAAASCERLRLDGLVVIGGDDSNTNAAVLAEHFLAGGVSTSVVGVPKTIDGDLKGGGIETSFGFDTATKLYGELIGHIARDAASARKYWHVIKLMGRSASHVTLECALTTAPNVALIGEEVRHDGMTLGRIADTVADVVVRRAAGGRRYGVCLVPEGLIEFVPEMRGLIDELNAALADGTTGADTVRERLSPAARVVFDGLPPSIAGQLLLDRDSHGNVQVSRIDTEQLVCELVAARLDGDFPVQTHFFGYEGRAAAPSDFDADYTDTLGRLAALLVARGRTGYLCAVSGLAGPPERWSPAALPLTSLIGLETRHGRPTPVIRKALVELDGAPFGALAATRSEHALEDAYRSPGPIQYFGPSDIRGRIARTLELEYPVADAP